VDKKNMGAPHYSQELWATIEALYESSRFPSVEKLHKHCKKLFKPCPSIDSIRKRFHKKQPDKHKNAEQIKEYERKKYAEIFEELGVGRFDTAKIIQQGIMTGPILMSKAIQKLEEDGPISDELMAQIKEMYASWNTTYRFIRERNKLTGDYAPEKIKHSGKVITATPEDDMSPEELESELKRLEKGRKK
jgi:hypothetical protein